MSHKETAETFRNVELELAPQRYVKHPHKEDCPPLPLDMAPYTWDIEKMRNSLELLEKSICGYQRNIGHNQQLEYEHYGKIAQSFVAILQSTVNLAEICDIDLKVMADSALMESIREHLI